MKAIIVMMIASVLYFAVLNIVNTKVEEMNYAMNSKSINEVSNEKSYFAVTIIGAVASPGTYTVTKGSNLGYLITLAGGVTENADHSTFDMSAKLSEGRSYYIGYKTSNDKISINTANAALLDTLPGIGSTIASRIITYRTKNGNFESLEDLKNVSGIGDNLFNQIKELICL